MSDLFLLLPCFIVSVFSANRVDLDQTPPSAASDLGLHCLSISFLWDAGHGSLLESGFTAPRVKCRGTAVKSHLVRHHSTVCIFTFLKITETILVSFENRVSLKRAKGYMQPCRLP